MFYIRLLKLPPDEVSVNQSFTIVWTITNDLGEIQFSELVTVTCQLEGNAYFVVREKSAPKTVDLTYDPAKNGGVAQSILTIAGSIDAQLQISLACASSCSISRKHNVWLRAKQHANTLEWIIPVWSQTIAIAKKSTGRTSHEHERRVVVNNMNTEVVRIRESVGTSMAHHVWDCGLMLCYYFAHLPFIQRSRYKRLLELGSGTAISGIYGACVLRPDHVYLTDLPEALADISRNVALQNGVINATVAPLEWGTHINSIESPVDLVIMADLLYNPSSHDALIVTIIQLEECNPGLSVLLSYKPRYPTEERIFFEKIRNKGWKCDQDTTTVDCSPCEIYWLRKPM
ncbi:putative methyltransferase-domain-containing protein [Dichotomocladium elegans]|nr:putative methyltransferase-domain-containing protein [Dichotomocladium elegans]